MALAPERPTPFSERPLLATVATVVLALPLVGLVVLSTTASPAETLVALIALATVVALLLRVEAALLVLVAAGALEEAFQLSANPQLTLTKVAGAICFASFARYALTSRRPLLLDRSHAVVVGILLLALASTVQAFDTSTALTTTTRYASFVALYVVVSQFVGAHVLQRRVAWVLTLASAAAAAIALESYFDGDTVVATLPYANPSDFAFILATTVPLTFWLLGSSPRWRLPLLGVIALIAAAIVLSLSRGTIVGLAAGLAWMVLVDRRHVRLVLGGGLLALLVAVLVIRSDPSRFETALLYKQKVADYNVTTRYDAWTAAAELAVEKPLLGVGPGNYPAVYEQYYISPWRDPLGHAHNYYINMAAEAGLLGLSALMIVLFLAFRTLLHRYRAIGWPEMVHHERLCATPLPVTAETVLPAPFARALAIGLLGSLVMFCTHNLFDNLLVHGVGIQIGILLGLIGGVTTR